VKRDRYAQIRRIFLDACQLAGDQRERFLDQACGGDSALREEVVSLMRHHDDQTLLEATPARASTATGRPAISTLDQLAAVQRFLPARRDATGETPRQRRVQRRRLAIRSSLVAVLLMLLGHWVYSGINTSLRAMRASKLDALLNNQVLALRFWIKGEKAKVESWARNETLMHAVEQLLAIDTRSTRAGDLYGRAPQRAQIKELLERAADHDLTYAVWDLQGIMVANDFPMPDQLGTRIPATGSKTFFRALAGDTMFIRPHADHALIRETPRLSDHPIVAILTPIRDHQGSIVAVLGVADTGTDDMFSEILASARTGETGETYAFDAHGLMLTESRFKKQLKACGLIADVPGAHAGTVVQLRDPGGDLTAGYRPVTPLAARRLTHMAAHATAGENGIDLDGYRDYRGVEVIGAWRWLKNEDFGVATEIDLREAYAPLRYLRVAFGAIFGLLIVSVASVLVSSYRVHRLTQQVGQAEQLGQYTLVKKIGEGGMGEVYLARHALLRRPTAIKLLKPDLVNPETVARFQREVRLASQLSHPNTIEIYDYGRTPGGVFYYAMEYLRGITLERLVAIEQTVSPARTVSILRQVCQSLAEAHAVGMVHRDIKPLNIMLCRRGGQDDVVKVLDFGLVKQIDTDRDGRITQPGQLSGTPLYIAPERLEDPNGLDTRSDIFSLGAVTFKLLTGRDAFGGVGPLDLFYQLTHAPRPRPSGSVDTPIAEPLDQLVVDCLATDPDDRPQTVVEILDVLNSLPKMSAWTAADAGRWWDARPELLADEHV